MGPGNIYELNIYVYLPDDRYYTFVGFDVTVRETYPDLVGISTHILRLSFPCSVPATVVVGVEDLLAPAVEYPELYYPLEGKVRYLEHIVLAIAIRAEA